MSTPHRVLGVDAGGTGTKAVIVVGGLVTVLPSSGPLNGLMSSDIANRIEQLAHTTTPDAIGLGIAGLREPEAVERVTQEIQRRTGIRPQIGDDAEVALWAGFGDAPGAIVIAGTGSAGVARYPDGSRKRVGGHGFLVGDEGSGYWIGREMARKALRAMTGVDKPDPELEALVTAALGSSIDDIERTIYGAPTDRSRLASLTRNIRATPGASIASILDEAASELTQLAKALTRDHPGFPIAKVGGLWEVSRIDQQFTAETQAEAVTVTPAEGAARWAHHAFTRAPASGV